MVVLVLSAENTLLGAHLPSEPGANGVAALAPENIQV
jgi:hypothetical protein